MGSKVHIATLRRKQVKLITHEKTLRNCLDMIKDQQRKLEIERLQLESMLDALNLDLNQTRSRQEFPPLTTELENVINEQELELGVPALQQMLTGSFYSNENEEEDEGGGDDYDDDDNDNDNDDDNNGGCVGGSVGASSANPSKRTKIDESLSGLQSDIFDFMDTLD
ncbi:hypothetical protein R5R35_014435 [Gryllus longicercus]|uniref:Uncharacterized protein n=1 Tax=Gryllus longicercus TaxID=2509291 RepID=A0AAN9VC86_9ORTH